MPLCAFRLLNDRFGQRTSLVGLTRTFWRLREAAQPPAPTGGNERVETPCNVDAGDQK